ncbi:sulfite exporter TauE/SafE family protein [Aquimarina gracilis]|uniref:Probable membrane transporter protein n=1 Tax=Aquimarina gracilis TaxID=874422 RepID=A0ABU5ZSK5_9FLAO|nr:sulfite exporter TauE/SafE family protein [Aquimarina gracilis]MEB3345065.1 sulfite exporter TauE/SafE family protein [Aquimarina gracilis]
MEITETIGFIAALVIGIILGLIGGGGSILTVPVFVYLIHLNPITATAYSLFVVGVSAFVGAINNIRKGLVSFRTAIVFAIPAFIAVYATRKYLVPIIPDQIFSIKEFMITKEIGIMIFFAIIMLLASISMIRNNKKDSIPKTNVRYNYPIILLEGAIIGILTGIVGAGGGFLIIPALVLLAKLPMKKAVATSLLIIAIKSLIGFIGDVENLEIDWSFLLLFTSISIVGILIGMYLSNFIEGKKLEKAFGWFVLVMGIYIIVKELT